jgi:hypothetical protein
MQGTFPKPTAPSLVGNHLVRPHALSLLQDSAINDASTQLRVIRDIGTPGQAGKKPIPSEKK